MQKIDEKSNFLNKPYLVSATTMKNMPNILIKQLFLLNFLLCFSVCDVWCHQKEDLWNVI